MTSVKAAAGRMRYADGTLATACGKRSSIDMVHGTAARDPFRTIIPVIGKLLARLRGPRFACGDCARQAHCGLPPHDDCLYRLEQIARDGDRPRPKPIHTAAWPS